MAGISDSLTVVIRATDSKWGRRAAAAALQLVSHGLPEAVIIRRYEVAGGRKERYSSGYGVIVPVDTDWVLSLDADCTVYGDVRQLVTGAMERGSKAAIRHSPLQSTPRDRWKEGAYKGLYKETGLRYRRLGTTCAFLLQTDVALRMLPDVVDWRRWVDERTSLSNHYHHAQAAFALALAEAGVSDEDTWWWGPDEISFAGEPHGIIHHEAASRYKFPFHEVSDD